MRSQLPTVSAARSGCPAAPFGVEPLEGRQMFCALPHGLLGEPQHFTAAQVSQLWQGAQSAGLQPAPQAALEAAEALAAAVAPGYVPMAPTTQLAWAGGYFTPAGSVNLQGAPAAPDVAAGEAATYPTVQVNANGLPLLQSRPNGAGLELFLDFSFDNGYYHPFSTDGDRANFNRFEQHDIYKAWRDVASAFSFLDVNVTTVLPVANHNFAWIAITNEFVWGGEGAQPGIGQGRGAFAHHTFALEGRTGGLIHELGHNLGMWHSADYDFAGNKTHEYTAGIDGRNRFFMGNVWAGGNYRFDWGRTSEAAWAVQDQIGSALYWITRNIGGDGFRPDDYGNDFAGAFNLGNGTGAIQRDGYIERPWDNDVFRITPTTTGRWAFSANPLWLSTARPVIQLEDASGKVLAVDDDAGLGGANFGANFTANVQAGQTHYVRVAWDGDYSSLGYYNFSASPLPAQFNTVTIGDPVQPGNAAWDPGTNTLTHIAGGGDTWEKWDQEQFIYATLNGDGRIAARIDGVDNVAAFTKAGIEIRQAGWRDSPRVYFGRKPDGSLEEIARDGYDRNAFNPRGSPGSGPWVRIERFGPWFDFWHSADGVNWVSGGNVYVEMSGPVMIGVTSSANSHHLVAATTVSNITVEGRRGGTIGDAAPAYNTLPAPTNVVATAAAGQTTDVVVSWTVAAGAQGYGIERSNNGVDYYWIANVGAGTTSYRDSGTDYAKRWFYRVHTLGAANPWSAPSAPASVVNKPGAPRMTWGYTTPDVIWSDSEIFLNWIDAHGENGYRIERSTDGVNYAFDHNLPANATAANVGALQPGQRYSFKVTPTSPRGDGVPLVIASQTRLGNRAVENLRFTNKTQTSLSIAWNDLGVEDGYRVERSTDGVNWAFLGDAPRDVTTWTENNLTPGGEYYYRVQPWNSLSAGGWSAVASATRSPALPAGWAEADVGAVSGGGAAVGNTSGAWSMVSGGGDLFGTADSFHFAYRPVTGDATIIARVDAVENTDDGAKAGLVIRQDLTAGGKSVAVMLNAGGGFGIDVRSRTTAGGGTAYQQVRPNATAPYWLKLVKRGGTVTAHYSADGITFTQAATVNLSLAGTFYVGLANTSADGWLLNTSRFSGVAVTGGQAPTIRTRGVFYNASRFDGGNPAATAADDAGIAPDKAALLPGQTAGNANYTSYSRGINGVVIDLDLPAATTALQSDDFEFRRGNDNNVAAWTTAAAPTSILVRPGAGANGSDRVMLAWSGVAVVNGWLRVTVKANADTGLAAADVFYLGNAVGDTFNTTDPAHNFVVTATDATRTNNNRYKAAPVTSLFDHNRSGGTINGTDASLSRYNQGFTLHRLAAPATASALRTASAPAPAWWQTAQRRLSEDSGAVDLIG